MLCGIGRVKQLRHFIVQADQLRKFSGIQGICQLVAVHGLDTGKAHGTLDLALLVEFLQNLGLRLIVTAGEHHRHHVAGAEGILDLEIGILMVCHFRGFQIVKAIGIGTLIGQPESAAQQENEEERHHPAGLHRKLARKGDIGQQSLVLGLVDQGAKQDQQAGHQSKYTQQAQHNGLDHDDGHIQADAELHECQSAQAADGSQRRAADLGDRFAQGDGGRLLGALGLILIREPVAQDDGIVSSQGQLQHHRNGIGNEADGTAEKIGTHIQQRRHTEGHQQHHHFHISPGGQQQHTHDDHRGHHQNGAHLSPEEGILVIAHQGIDRQIITGQLFLDLRQRIQTDRIKIASGKVHIIQSRCFCIVV